MAIKHILLCSASAISAPPFKPELKTMTPEMGFDDLDISWLRDGYNKLWPVVDGEIVSDVGFVTNTGDELGLRLDDGQAIFLINGKVVAKVSRDHG